MFPAARGAAGNTKGTPNMTTYGIYEAAGADYEPVVVIRYADAAGYTLDALLLPHERQQEAAYVIVDRNAGAGARHLVEATRTHVSELGSCDVIVDPLNARRLMCVTCGVTSEPAVVELVQA